MRVLFIAYYFPPMGGSGVQRPVKFARHLEPLGVETHFLVPEPPDYHVHDASLLEQVPCSAERVHRVKGSTPLDLPAAGVFTRFYRRRLASAAAWLSPWIWLPDNKKGWIEPAFDKALDLVGRFTFDLIYATAAPYSNLILAARLGRETGLPVVMDLRDDWLHSHLIRYPTPWHAARMKRLEHDTLRQADALTVVNDGYRRALKSRIPDLPPTTVIPNGFDLSDFEPMEPRAAPRFTLLHNGLFYGRQQPDDLLHAVREAVDRKPEMRATSRVVFQGDFFERHMALARRLGLEQMIEARGGLPHRQAVHGLAGADVLWLTVPRQPHSENHTPGKLYEYFGSGKPILAFCGPGVTADLLERYGAAWTVPAAGGEAAVQALIQIHSAWQADRLPEPDVEWARQFDRGRLAQRLHKVFLKVLPG